MILVPLRYLLRPKPRLLPKPLRPKLLLRPKPLLLKLRELRMPNDRCDLPELKKPLRLLTRDDMCDDIEGRKVR